MSASAAPSVALEAVRVRFGARAALHDVDLSVAPGEFVALAGPNGSGKSTVLRLILGLVRSDAGRVLLRGDPVTGLSVRERARRVSWVPQEEALREEVPLARYLLYGRYAANGPFGAETREDTVRVDRLLHEIDLAERAYDSVLALSGGERQRAVLGRALAQESPVLLLDEPTSHLDIGHQLDLLERVRRLARDRGLTVVAAIHDLNLAGRFADRIVVLSAGRKVADGPPATVLSEELLARVWGVEADLRRDPATGWPYLVPRRLLGAPRTTPSGAGPVHIVGGGGAAAPLLRRLSEAGLGLTVGALHLLDSDTETAEALGVVAAVELPFAPLGSAVRERHRALLAAARAIVVAPFAVGPTNLANLEDVAPFVGRTPTFLLRAPPIATRDFADGRATALYDELLARGAVEVDGIDTLLRAVEPVLRSARDSATTLAGAAA